MECFRSGNAETTQIGYINRHHQLCTGHRSTQEQITANSPIVFYALEPHVVTYMGQMVLTSLSGNAQSAVAELKAYPTEV